MLNNEYQEYQTNPTRVDELAVGQWVLFPEYVRPIKLEQIVQHDKCKELVFENGSDVFLDDTVLNVVTNYKPDTDGQ